MERRTHVRALASRDQLRAAPYLRRDYARRNFYSHLSQQDREPGTFQAMTRGAVSEAWAWTFHRAWYKQVTGGDAVGACEEARRRGQMVRK